MNTIPLYREIYQDLLEKIMSGYYLEKTYLPSERTLCEMYHVSRATIRRALDDLRKDKYIEKKQGSGNFVKPQMYEQPLSQFHSFAGALRAQHIEITNQILSYDLIEGDKYLSEALTENEGFSRWHKLVRLRLANGYPLMIETAYLPRERFFRLDLDYLKSNSLYAYLELYYSMTIHDTNELLSPIMPTVQEAKFLQISPQEPCMLLERFCYENERLIAIHKTTVRGDKYKFRAFYYAN
ncbi:MAG: GntR family transcriptional regulator [Lachnospiraceae bacterium]|nr:GntR family transcriptional regulator [Lachnospiraceae bacterium]MCI9383022.1 GntR family transcriptional regulator [Lachnospiraceae bacterium]MCI9622768.1 GntR family transcriptional regulator [Lachnospiraceae bacterium]